MRKILILVLVATVLLPSVVSAQAAASFVESSAGTLTVSGKKVGVLTVDAGSYSWPLTWTLIAAKSVVAPDNFLSAGIKAEILAKTGKVMVLNPPGMEKIVSPFIVMKNTQMDNQESVAAQVPGIIAKTTSFGPEGKEMIQSMFNVTEFSGEVKRIDDYVAVYKKLLGLWGIDRLITIEQPSKFSFIIRGYEIDVTSISATMVYQYYLAADAVAFNTNMKRPANEMKNPDYNVKEDKVKAEDSSLNPLAIVKRISDSLK